MNIHTLIITDPCLSASHNVKVAPTEMPVIITDPCLSASHNTTPKLHSMGKIITDPCLSASHNGKLEGIVNLLL